MFLSGILLITYFVSGLGFSIIDVNFSLKNQILSLIKGKLKNIYIFML
jgi:hypothetical protein